MDILCQCGHPQSLHKATIPEGFEWCDGIVDLELQKERCSCPYFKPDNLLTVEQEAKKQGYNLMDIPCKCEHKKSEHLDDGIFSDCLKLYTSSGKECNCMKYIPDNLTYIEQEAKRQGII